jgi:hypothetical protein
MAGLLPATTSSFQATKDVDARDKRGMTDERVIQPDRDRC